MDPMINVGKRLKELRMEKGVTQLDLAEYLHRTPNTISLYEKGKQEFDLYAIKMLCEYFDISSDYLLCFTDIRVTKNTVSDTPKELSIEPIMEDIHNLHNSIDQLFQTTEYYMRVALKDKENKEAKDCLGGLELCKASIQRVLDLIAKAKEAAGIKE